jgi:hypothetical protein
MLFRMNREPFAKFADADDAEVESVVVGSFQPMRYAGSRLI